MNRDDSYEIINGNETYTEIAKKLAMHIPVLIGWTDEEMSHFDILFTYNTYKPKDSYIQRGIRADDLFVSVMGKGSFGFLMNDDELDGSYVGEKLGMGTNITTTKLAKLITGVKSALIQEIYKIKKPQQLKNFIEAHYDLPLVFLADTEYFSEGGWAYFEDYDFYIDTIWIDDDRERFFDEYDDAFEYYSNKLEDNDEYKDLKDEEYDNAVHRYIESRVNHFKAIVIKLWC